MESQEFIKKYRTRQYAIITLSIILALPVLLFPAHWIITVILYLVDFMLLSLVLTLIHQQKATGILVNELDPERYYYVSRKLGITTKYALEDIQTAYYMGDYHRALEICEEKKKITKDRSMLIQYKYFEAICCFGLRDFENLKILCDDFEHLFIDPKNKNFKNIFCHNISYFRNFIEGNYEKCKEIKAVLDAMPLKRRRKLPVADINFMYALACYENKDYEEAKKVFEEVAQMSDKLYECRLAGAYLTAGENGEVQLPEAGQLPYVETEKKAKLTLVDGIIVAIGALILVIGLTLFILNAMTFTGTPFEAIAHNEDISQAVEVIPVNEDGDVLCVFTAGDEIGIAYLDCQAEDEYVYGTSIYYYGDPDIYYILAGDSDLEIRFSICEQGANVPESLSVHEFSVDATAYSLCILSIEEFDCSSYVSGIDAFVVG